MAIIEKIENIIIGGEQKHWAIKKDGVCTCLTSSMRTGGGYIPMILNEVKVIGQMDNTMDHTFESANRVYDKNGIAPTINCCGGGGLQPKVLEDKQIVAMRGRNPKNPSDRTVGITTEQRLEPNKQGICNTLTSVQKDNLVMEKNEVLNETNTIEILRILQNEIGEKSFSEWAIRGLWCILQEEILQQNMYAKSIYKSWIKNTELFKFSLNSENDKQIVYSEREVRNMWENWQTRCTPQRQELSKQQYRKFDDFMSKLPFETTQRKKFVYCMWETHKGTELLRKALSTIQKIWESDDSETLQRDIYKIRKLTAKECWRLMDFSDEDFHKAEEVNSNTQLYKEAGNSIVRNVLVAIFGQMIVGKENVYREVI